MRLAGHHEGHRGVLVRVPVDADVLHERVGLEVGLHLAQGDVLAELQLHQVFLAVDDGEGA